MSGKKEAIRQAAIAVIAERGFHEAVIGMIASRAGVSVGTVYNYFASKDEILSHIFEVEYRKRLAFFESVKSDPQLEPLEQVEKILRFHFAELKANRDLAALLVREKSLPRACREPGAVRFRGLPQLLAEVLRDGIEEGSLRPHEPDIVAPCLMGAIDAAVAQFVMDPEGSRDHLGRTADEVINLLRHGLKKE
jgi:TetR/AcrR family fatty acid metabolism transcriptional regulator